MINEHPIRTRYQAVRPLLDERGRRLHVAAEAISAGYGGVAAASRHQGRAEHHRSWHQGPAGAWFVDRQGASERRRPAHGHGQGRNAARRPGALARDGDDGRSDAPAAVGLEEPPEAGDGAVRDGPSGECLDHSEAAGAVGVSPPRQSQDQGRRAASGPRCAVRLHQHQGAGVPGSGSASDLGRHEEEGADWRVQEPWQ